ncbi:MAG TPA: nucleotidyltransferase [Thermoflexia bacterium]|nr:nucleotidyltransferase [Thermoflexia bacterium]
MAELKRDISAELVASFCRQWQINELSLFESILREDFGAESDLDVLVTFDPGAQWSLLDHIRMEEELSNLLQRQVDLLTKRAVERSSNWMLRREILGTAEVVYGPITQVAGCPCEVSLR